MKRKNYTTESTEQGDARAMRRAIAILKDPKRHGAVMDVLRKELAVEMNVKHLTVNINL